MNLMSSNLQTAPAVVPAMQSGGAEQENVPVIRQYLRIAMRRRYLIMAAIGLCLLLGLIATLLMTPKYTAEATIEISRESNKITYFQGVEREASVADQEFYQDRKSVV